MLREKQKATSETLAAAVFIRCYPSYRERLARDDFVLRGKQKATSETLAAAVFIRCYPSYRERLARDDFVLGGGYKTLAMSAFCVIMREFLNFGNGK